MDSIDYAFKILDLFDENYAEAYLVGGSVRDYLLTGDFSDFDFATPCQPAMILNILDTSEYDKFSFKYGTIKTEYEGVSIEITSFRKEGEYLDYRHPSTIKFVKDMQIDSLRRDFTINALYMNSEGKILDYHHGLDDLDKHIIRMVGNPLARIKEDPVRIIRAARFALKLGFNIDDELFNAIKDCKSLLSKISSERIKMELAKMTEYASKQEIDAMLDKLGILEYCYVK